MLQALTGIVAVGVRVLHEPITLRGDLQGRSDQPKIPVRSSLATLPVYAGGNNIEFLWDRNNDVTGN